MTFIEPLPNTREFIKFIGRLTNTFISYPLLPPKQTLKGSYQCCPSTAVERKYRGKRTVAMAWLGTAELAGNMKACSCPSLTPGQFSRGWGEEDWGGCGGAQCRRNGRSGGTEDQEEGLWVKGVMVPRRYRGYHKNLRGWTGSF